MKIKLMFTLPVIAFITSCGYSDSNQKPSNNSNHALISSSVKDFDTVNTKITLSNCADSAGAVSFNANSQSANSIVLPVPGASNITCNVTLSQLGYVGPNNASFIFSPASTALIGSLVIQTNGSVTVSPPATPTLSYSGTSTSASNLVAAVTFSTASSNSQIQFTWNVSGSNNVVTIQNFTPVASNSVSPTVTSVTLIDNPAAKNVAAALRFINDSGAPDAIWSATLSAASIFKATTLKNTTAGAQCFVFYDAANGSVPAWFNADLSATSTDYPSFASAQYNPSGFVKPVDYASTDALFQNAQATVALASNAATTASASGEQGYYVSSNSHILGFFNCSTLLSYSLSNWGGLAGSANNVIPTVTDPDFARYNWFVIFGNDLNSTAVSQPANAYTILSFPAITTE